ncbi:MAG: methyltransferase domain-containing protein [Candidatus Delongbacteria bacterium]|nr:methyltransferase domain-containing protein [Candidatus Delongbacteria bacterium]
MNQVEKWDKMSERFNVHKQDKIDASAADNIIIAWPIFLKELNSFSEAKILDFGCGTGGFCNKLNELGHNVTGIDTSEKMINHAKLNSPQKIKFIVEGKDELNRINEKFDIITSIMVFQFIEDIESYLSIFSKILNEKGKLIFATINPDFVKRASEIRYKNIHEENESVTANMDFGQDIVFKIFARSENEYKKLFEKYGLKFNSVYYPEFTEEFVKKYDWKLPYDVPEFLIMSFLK